MNQDPSPIEGLSTKDRILIAALSTFGELGFVGATTREIAKRAGVTEVTLFRIFKSKEELFQAVMHSNFPIGGVLGQLDFDLSRPVDEALKEYVGKVLRNLQNNRDRIMVLVGDIPRRPHPDDFLEFVMRNLVGPLDDYLIKQAERGVFRKMDTEVASRSLLGVVQAYYLTNYLIDRKEIDKEADKRFVDGFVDIFLNGVKQEVI